MQDAAVIVSHGSYHMGISVSVNPMLGKIFSSY